MAKNSKIEWTHHTFNPWWGCTKVSAACKHCYAENWAKRVGAKVWGAKATRRFFSDTHWRQPVLWNRDAMAEQIRSRVFCASMADVFEKRRELDAWRDRLWALIKETPWLDWLLLTKRPENIGDLVPWTGDWPRNVWLGATVESQRWVERRLPALLRHKSAVRFLSCEPLLGKIDLQDWLHGVAGDDLLPIDWVIAGGESGGRARPMHPNWVRFVRDQCVAASVPFHFKQWGTWAPSTDNYASRLLRDGDGPAIRVAHVGKKVGGRLLDGRTWDEVPMPFLEDYILRQVV